MPRKTITQSKSDVNLAANGSKSSILCELELELRATCDDLHSSNEELLSVNKELQIRSAEDSAPNQDFNNIKESIDFPIIVVDKELCIKQFNSAAYALFLLDNNSEGESLTNISAVIDIPDLRKNVLTVIMTGNTFVRQLDTEQVCYNEKILPYKDEYNNIHGAVLTYIDNTVERAYAVQLSDSKARYDLAVRSSNAGVWDWDIKKKEMYWSSVFQKMLGIRGNKSFYEFEDFAKRIHPDESADVLAILDAHLNRGFEFNVEFRIERNVKDYIWVHMRGQAEWDEQKIPYRMAGAIYDITERRNAMEQLTSSNQALERFAYVCSHDLKEPARIVENYSELFMSEYYDQVDEKGRRYLGHMLDSSQHMQEMVKSILTYSQLENKSTAFTNVDCNEEMEKVLQNLKLSIEETEAVITYDDLPVIRADRMQLFQVFMNLISNAIKFCQDVTPTIHIGVEDRTTEWLFTVKDNGIGMKQEYATRIFGVFQRLHTKEEFPGTGIGLSICHKVVSKHGGRIWVTSSEGKGATFHFTIPQKQTRRRANHDYCSEPKTG